MQDIEKLLAELYCEELLYAQKMSDDWSAFEQILRAQHLEHEIKVKCIKGKISQLDRRGKQL
jgi:hypothetical protein